MRGLRCIAAAAAGAAALSSFGQVPSFSLEAQQRLLNGRSATDPNALETRRQFVEDGEARLDAGDAAGALQAFEAAASIVHAADVELGLVRTYMQSGEYRRALAFGAHAAGAHRELPSGMALYAWLLHIGGQQVVAKRMLDDWLDRAPQDPVLLAARLQLSGPSPRADGVLASTPWRMAPNDGSKQIPASASVAGTGLLGNDGRSAVTPATAVGEAGRLWVRNGLGQSAPAHVASRLDDIGLVVLALDGTLAAPAPLTAPSAAPFAGSASFMVEFTASPHADPAWPMVRQGFFSRYSDPLLPRPLGIEVSDGARGGPVFDKFGQLAGVAIRSIDGTDRMIPASAISSRLPGFLAEGPVPVVSGPVAMDSVYEAALRSTLQVVVDR